MHSQENEEKIIGDYLRGTTGTLLSIGENDGITLSNTRQLILDGWGGVLIEPSKAYERLEKLYSNNPKVYCYPCAIGTESGIVPFFESSEHVSAEDTGLISTMIPEEVRRWKGSRFDNFTPTEVLCYTWKDFYKTLDNMKFDFVTIDTEGMDWPIIQQMDMDELGCRIACVEFNQVMERRKQFEDYFHKYKFKLLGVTYHNLIFAK